jgi:hypothetical protein
VKPRSERFKRLLILAAFLWAGALVGSAALHLRAVWAFVLVLPVVLLFWAAWRDKRLLWELTCIYWGAGALAELAEGSYLVASLFGLNCAIWICLRGAVGDAAPIKVPRLKAPRLAGAIEYGKLRFSGMRVEECSKDWVGRLSETETDEDGRFALPETPGAPMRYLRVVWMGGMTAHVQVELSPRARPLVVHLEPRNFRRPR